jgi:rhamnosyltransferase
MSRLDPKVCVLLAVYNGEKFVKQQINSILYQCDVSCNIFVSVDLSDDKSVEIIKDYSENFDNVHLVSDRVRFGSAAKNFYHLIKTVDVTTYDYVCFADQDDIWFPDKVSSAISKIVSEKVSGFSSDVYAFWPDKGKFKTIRKSRPMTGLDHFFESPGPGCSQVFTAISFVKFQRFFSDNEEKLSYFDYHDWLVYAFYKESDLGWSISDVPGMLYIQHSQNQIGANSGLAGLFLRLRLARSKWYRSQVSILVHIFNRPEILSKGFMVSNVFGLRRSKLQALFVLFMFVLGFM